MCSTSLSSGLLQSHVSSLSLPSVGSVSNTQVATIKYTCVFWELLWELHVLTMRWLSPRFIQVPALPTAWPPLSLLPAVSPLHRRWHRYLTKPRPHWQVREDPPIYKGNCHTQMCGRGGSSLSVPFLRARPWWLPLPVSGELTEGESFITVCLISFVTISHRCKV